MASIVDEQIERGGFADDIFGLVGATPPSLTP